MTGQITKLALDVDMSNPDNEIPNEQHAANKKVVVAKYGAFFTKSLVVIQGGRELTEGSDYDLAGYNAEAAEVTGQSVHIALVVKTSSPSPVLISYHAVGDRFANYIGVIIDMLNELNLVDDIVRASDIVGLPIVYPPGPHRTHGDDLVGLERVVEMLARLEDAVLTGNPAVIQSLRTQIADKVSKSGPVRLNIENAHRVLPDRTVDDGVQDLSVPRSEEQTSRVAIELLIVGETGVMHGWINYREVPNGVTDVSFIRHGGDDLNRGQIGINVGNNNRTIIRFKNAPDATPYSEVTITRIVTGDLVTDYNAVSWPETPTSTVISLRDFVTGN